MPQLSSGASQVQVATACQLSCHHDDKCDISNPQMTRIWPWYELARKWDLLHIILALAYCNVFHFEALYRKAPCKTKFIACDCINLQSISIWDALKIIPGLAWQGEWTKDLLYSSYVRRTRPEFLVKATTLPNRCMFSYENQISDLTVIVEKGFLQRSKRCIWIHRKCTMQFRLWQQRQLYSMSKNTLEHPGNTQVIWPQWTNSLLSCT